MTYQPNLFSRNIGNVCANKVHELVSNYQFGKISAVELIHKKKETSAIIKMEHWNTRHTECTRIMLSQGKPILLYHTDDKCWKVYAYNEPQRMNVQSIKQKMRVENKQRKQALIVVEQKVKVKVEESKQEVNDEWSEINEEYERKQVALDYGDIATYKGDTAASRKLQKKMLKYKV